MNGAMDLAGAILLALGAFFCMSAAIGVLRSSDVMGRMHYATKPQVFGLILVLGGVTLTLRSVHVTLVCLVIVALQLLTAPVAGHMVARTAYRIGAWNADGAVVDDLSDDLARAGFIHRPEDLEPALAQEGAEAGEPGPTDAPDDLGEPEASTDAESGERA